MFDHLHQIYHQGYQIKALQRLSDPSDYPSLGQRDSREILLQLFVLPSFHPMTSWTVYSAANDSFFVRRVRWDLAADHQTARCKLTIGEPTTYGADASFPSSMLAPRLARLATISIPAFNLPTTLGTDGVSYGLRRKTFEHSAELMWWCEPPVGWEAIAEWHQDFVAALESGLPAHTDLFRREATAMP